MRDNNSDNPQTLIEAVRYFSDQDVCLQFMVDLRWPDGVVCPRCASTQVGFVKTRRIWNCKGCKEQFSAKVGTIMEDSPLPLTKWLPCFWFIANAKNGTSSCQVGRDIGVRQATAWFMLHRIRVAMAQGSIEKMSGTVEADESFIGGKASNMHKRQRKEKIHGRGTTGKEIVMGILERPKDPEKAPSKVRTKHIKNTKSSTLHKAIAENVEHGSEVFTDAALGYDGLDHRYVHRFVDHAQCYVIERVHTNGLENYWCLLKRTIRGTYVHVNADHLNRYLDEQTFRFNERGGNDADRFATVLKSIVGRRLTYAQLIEMPKN